MPETGGSLAGLLEWGVATLPMAGEQASGDHSVVKAVGNGVLVGVVDGLGHGEEAAASARAAVSVVERFAHEPVVSVVQRCHDALIGKRGVVMSLAFFDGRENTMTWVGVGNVEGLLVPGDPLARPKRSSLITRGGIVGSSLPHARPWVIPVLQGDILVFATDGVRSVFADDLNNESRASPLHLARGLLARLRKETDDALVLVARYLGGVTPAA